jgi:hypothetical protein
MGVITAFQLTYDHPERVRTAVQLSVGPAFITDDAPGEVADLAGNWFARAA